ncbi:MAG TPA: APC family permease [Synechococcales bacterium UBA10510]|nr:APC family permease [Synechococcales bacterium UBA10510]
MANPAPGKLLQVLGLGFGLAGAVGGTIGAGILRTPGLVAGPLGQPSWILAAWLLGGIYALLGAVCVAELATSLPQAGGWTVYASRAFGARAGFLVGWSDWLAHCIGLAWVATTAGEYGQLLLPGLPPRALAMLVVVLFALIQWRGVRAGSASQELLSLVKTVAFLLLVIACFLLPTVAPESLAADQSAAPAALAAVAVAAASANAPAAALAATASGAIAESASVATASALGAVAQASPALLLGAMAALQAVITTYDGWASPIYFAEEFQQPERDLPRSLIGGVLAVLALYLLFNAALLHLLSPAQLAGSSLPAADAARLLAGPPGALLITGLALVSLLGLINTVVMAAPRILYGLSRAGIFPAWASQVNPGGTPTNALLLTTITCLALVLIGSFEHLLAMGAFLYVALPLSGIAALVVLRQREPQLARPFRVWAYPLPPLLISAVSLAFLAGELLSSPLDCAIAASLVLAGYPIELFSSRAQA